MFITKPELIVMFEQEFAAWEQLLASLNSEQLTQPWLPDGLSMKDTLAHLAAWQQRTVAQLEGELQGHEPHYPVAGTPLWGSYACTDLG